MRLWYFLRSDTPLFDKMSKAWEDAAEQFVKKEWSDNELIEAFKYFYSLIEAF